MRDRTTDTNTGVRAVAEWRFLSGWTRCELEERLRETRALGRNFSIERAETAPGWRRDGSRFLIAREVRGRPVRGGAFDRTRRAVADYEFSDPGIVRAYLNPQAPLAERDMLLIIRVLGFRYLCPARVTAVRAGQRDGRSFWGYRYDTLDGHIERGFEWFVVTKDHATGAVRFEMRAAWALGDFPNRWSRLGFRLLAPSYRGAWRRRARRRVRHIARRGGGNAPCTAAATRR